MQRRIKEEAKKEGLPSGEALGEWGRRFIQALDLELPWAPCQLCSLDFLQETSTNEVSSICHTSSVDADASYKRIAFGIAAMSRGV